MRCSAPVAQRVRDHPEIMPWRQQLAEHPCGTLKRAFHQGDFLLRGLQKVKVEMRLRVLAYHGTRALNILGGQKLIEGLKKATSGMVHARCLISFRAVRHARGVLLRAFSHNLATGQATSTVEP